MDLPQTGGCVCGALRYELTAPPQSQMYCCCTDCQKMTGGAMSVNLLVPAGSIRITRGTPRTFVTPGDSGLGVVREFCGDCGTQIVSTPRALATVTVLKAGTLDDTSWVQPQAAIYTSSAPPWAALPEGLPRFPKLPPR